MDVNKIKIIESIGNKEIVVPISINPDLLDREGAIIEEEQNIVQQIIGSPINYELSRYGRAKNSIILAQDTSLTYTFNFSQDVNAPSENSYLSKFTENQLRYNTDAFKNSFYKLDFYDTMDPKKQKNYLTIILPTRMSNTLEENGCEEYQFIFTEESEFLNELKYTNCCGQEKSVLGKGGSNGVPDTTVSFCYKFGTTVYYIRRRANDDGQYTTITSPVNLNESTTRYTIFNVGTCRCDSALPSGTNSRPLPVPIIQTDFNKNQEGFFLHWFQDKSVLNIDNLYMSAKFFDASVGKYIKFIVNDQISYANKYRIPYQDFYYRVELDYTNNEYSVYYTNTNAFADTVYWYEYKNPPIGI